MFNAELLLIDSFILKIFELQVNTTVSANFKN